MADVSCRLASILYHDIEIVFEYFAIKITSVFRVSLFSFCKLSCLCVGFITPWGSVN